MKRTTIFPSRLVHLSAVLGLAFAAAAAPASLVAQAPTPAPAARVTAPPPATHVVQQGETLWALAQEFFGDPLLWPEIYRLNTAVIEDPHWIYPGEELHLTGAGSEVAAGPGGAAPAESAGAITVSPSATVDTTAPEPEVVAGANPAVGPTIFDQHSRIVPEATLRLRQRAAYRAVREGEFLSAGFLLMAGETLPAGQVLGNTATSTLNRLTTTSGAGLYGHVALVPPPGMTLKAGTMLESFELPRTIPGYGSVVLPTGLLKVTNPGTSMGDTAVAEVVAAYQAIASGQGVMPAPVYHPVTGVHPVPVNADSAITGEVIGLRTPHEIAEQQDVLFLNRGSDDGVRPGDIFQISGIAPASAHVGPVVQNKAQVLVVYTRPHVSTAVIIQLSRPDVHAGSTARLIRRMPS
jgi:LysM repeat protein